MKFKHVSAALFMTLLWGANFPIMKLGIQGMPPLLFSALRSVCILPLLFFVPRPPSWKAIWVMGIFIGTLKLPLMLLAIYLGIPSGLAALLAQTHIFFTIFLGIIWLKEWPTPQNGVSIFIAFSGIVLIISQMESNISSLYGLGVVMLAALVWAISNIKTRQTQHLNILHLVLWMNIIPPVPLLGLSCYVYGGAALWESLIHMSLTTFLSLLYASFLSGIVGYAIWGTLLRNYPPARVVHFSLLVPITAMSFSFLLLGETPGKVNLIGCALIFAGLIFNQFNLKRKILSTQTTIEE